MTDGTPQREEAERGNVPDVYRGSALQGVASSPLAVSMAGQASRDRLDFSTLIGIFRRRMVMFFTILALCIQIAFLLTQWTPPKYSAVADVVLHPRGQEITPGATQVADEPQRSEDVETNLAQLRSRGLASKVYDALNLGADRDFLSHLKRREGRPDKQAALDTMVSSLDVVRVGNAFVLRITYVDRSPERAARIANGYAGMFTQEQVRAEVAGNETAIRVLKTRMEQLRGQAQADFGALQQYRIKNNLQTPSGTSLTEQEISAYNQQVAVARAQVAEAGARLNPAATATGAASSGATAALRAQRAQISARLSDLSSRYLDTHPEVIAARDQLADIDRQIAQEQQRTVAGLAVDALASSQKLASLSGSLGRATGTLANNNTALVAMDDLSRRAEASQQLYESYLARYKEAVARSGAEQPRSEILSPAPVPTKPSSPILLLNLILGTLIGLLLGGVSAIIAESGFTGLTTGDDVEKRLGIRYLGSLPLSHSLKPHGSSPIATVQEYPGGLMAEQVRGLLTSIRQSSNARNQVLAVTSTLPGEGKTTTALLLAQVSRMAGQTVAIVDCDVVRRSLSASLGPVDSKPGLRDYLAGAASLREVMTEILGGVMLLPITSRFGKGERLLQDGKFQRLIAVLRESYDVVILDCAPILPIAETREIVTLADNVIMVTRWRSTSERAVRAAAKMLPIQSIHDLGVVMNCVDMRKRVRFGGGDSDVFHRSYQHYYQH